MDHGDVLRPVPTHIPHVYHDTQTRHRKGWWWHTWWDGRKFTADTVGAPNGHG